MKKNNNLNISNNGQISMEFIISILFVLMIFALGMIIFQNRLFLNQQNFERWDSKSTVDRFARNINNAYLMNNNSYYIDYIYFEDFNQSIELGDNSIIANYQNGFFASAPVIVPVQWNITDVNGAIYFWKKDNVVVVDYE